MSNRIAQAAAAIKAGASLEDFSPFEIVLARGVLAAEPLRAENPMHQAIARGREAFAKLTAADTSAPSEPKPE